MLHCYIIIVSLQSQLLLNFSFHIIKLILTDFQRHCQYVLIATRQFSVKRKRPMRYDVSCDVFIIVTFGSRMFLVSPMKLRLPTHATQAHTHTHTHTHTHSHARTHARLHAQNIARYLCTYKSNSRHVCSFAMYRLYNLHCH